MSLGDFKKNLEKVKVLSEDYERLMKEKERGELDIRNLKAKYREDKVEREVFGEYNKKLNSVNKELGGVREKVVRLCRKNSDIIGEELKNVL